MVWPCVATVSCGVVLRFPACIARLRIVWTVSSTACCWFTYASPSAEVQERFLSMLARTEGNCVSAFTLGSQGILSTAWASASPFRFVFCCIQRSASTISVGYVDAARTCATKASGYRAIGATSCSSCWGDCCTTASPPTAAGSGAGGLWEQARKDATGRAQIQDLITDLQSPPGDADPCVAGGAPTDRPDQFARAERLARRMRCPGTASWCRHAVVNRSGDVR